MSFIVSPNTLAVSCYAKLNLTFSILGILPDGYHQVDTLYQSVNLEDRLLLTFDRDGNSISFDLLKSKAPSGFPFDNKNIIVNSIKKYLQKIDTTIGVSIAIEKDIPMAAGLAGGSSDAAGALFALNTYFENKLSKEELTALAIQIGADVPFCLHGGSMRGENKGEILTQVQHETGIFFLLAKPSDVSLSTPLVFKAYDERNRNYNQAPKRTTEAAIHALSTGNIKELAKLCGNDFESCVFEMHPELKLVCDDMKDNDALTAHLSGSGPTVYGIFHDFISAEVALSSLGAKFPNFDTWICASANRGVALMEPLE